VATFTVGGIQAQDAQVQHRAFTLARRHLQGMAAIGNHLLRIELHSPCRQQRPRLRGLVGLHGRHGILRIGAGLVGVRQRIDEHRDAPAAQRELVDRKLHAG
jgi:hypothetical protein